ncbi:LysR substrate-binding domain-containing protein [Defluviimonas sp. WL0024]|uniref:LysR substrate-binding domain-containing protein n=1 Tax=Albidovulum salinarum TaxID=2984153 RepID=A0ABT2WY23_9RHOB|nr:LysR substrate-binding domain-containing protein [Defluviimonas sp. WL0024]MCU9846576.1 LysR substrate-binding domain-containing protein [Defluviimonas sp. WL0024]
MFDMVARHLSITAAADVLNQSKGSISYQISKLENELGFLLFERANARLALTEAGRRLWHVSQSALSQIDREVAELRGGGPDSVTIGALTYFASRWLSPRLTRFFEAHPGLSLRIEPINSVDELRTRRVDLAILWGVGEWTDLTHELLFACPAVPTANRPVAEKVREIGIEQAVRSIPLLGDSSGDAGWRAWHEAAGLPYQPSRASLVLQDSGSRVQAVIDGQGLALWDRLIAPELEAGTLMTVADHWLTTAGYHIILPQTPLNHGAQRFLTWIRSEATAD